MSKNSHLPTVRRIAFAAIIASSLTSIAACSAPAGEVEAVSKKTISFFIEAPEDFIAMSHSGAGPLKSFPPGINPLPPASEGNSLALISKLRSEDGEIIGVASELEYFPMADEFSGDNVFDSYWTVVISGRGSLFLYHEEALGAEAAKIFMETPMGTEDWTGNLVHSSSVGPASTGRGVIVGGTGEFAGASGEFEEIGTLRRFTPEGELEATIELRVRLLANP